MLRLMRVLAVVLLLPLVVAGCGVRGSLDAPPEAKQQGTATSPEAGASGANSSAPKKEYRPFPLDPLIR